MYNHSWSGSGFSFLQYIIVPIGASLAGMDVSAAALKISDSIPTFLRVTSRVVQGYGIYDNYMQIRKDGFNWTDAVQMAAGAILIGLSFTPVGAGVAVGIFVAEVGLFIWELAEGEY